jgi:periplasmic divalent cation tolerance protein
MPSHEQALSFSEKLVKSDLAACVQIQAPCTSIYKWKGALENTMEYPMHIKTSSKQKMVVEQLIADTHPYEVPEIITIELSNVSQSYADWVASQTSECRA